MNQQHNSDRDRDTTMRPIKSRCCSKQVICGLEDSLVASYEETKTTLAAYNSIMGPNSNTFVKHVIQRSCGEVPDRLSGAYGW